MTVHTLGARLSDHRFASDPAHGGTGATLLALFADRRIPAGKAARELGLERIPFMELLKQRGIPYVVYTADDWNADGKALNDLARLPKVG